MMGDFLGRLLDWARDLWPFRTVEPWEDGFYVTLSKPGKRVGPGIWPVVPYFQDVKALSVAESRVTSPMLNVVLQNGKRLAFSVSARVRVVDVVKALVDVGSYQETSGEEIAAHMAEVLSEAPAERFETIQKRRNFIAKATDTLNERTNVYGVEVIEVQFTNWIEDIRTYRILSDSALSPPSLTW
jgi:hypothetical protein